MMPVKVKLLRMCNERRLDLENCLVSVLKELPDSVEVMVKKLSLLTSEKQLEIFIQSLREK